MQSPSEVSSYYFRHYIIPVLSSSCQGSKRRKAQVSQVRNALLPQNSHCVSFPILRQLRLHTCFSLHGWAPSFLVCFTIFPVILRTPGSYSNIRSQIRPFKFTAHMLQLTLLRNPNRTTNQKKKHACILHFICTFPFQALNTLSNTATKAKCRETPKVWESYSPTLQKPKKPFPKCNILPHRLLLLQGRGKMTCPYLTSFSNAPGRRQSDVAVISTVI